MSVAYCSYCDAETEAGQGAVCASCGRGRGSLFPDVLTPDQVAEYARAHEPQAWVDQYLQRPEPRRDRLIIDDPHATMTDGEIAEARNRGRAMFANLKTGAPAVIIMARLSKPESDQ